jgi:PAS domain S-box-containing protein
MNAAPLNILIAEDESIVAMDIEEALKNARYSVLGIVSSGREAVQKASETRPDLVLMDIRLEGDMDGVQAARQIREKYNIPVIYLTAHSDPATLERAKRTEPYGYLLKPFEKENLYTTIEMALYKHKMERQVQESRRWLAAILRSTGDAVIATDSHGLITFMNPVAEKMTGLSSVDARGRIWMETVQLLDGAGNRPPRRLAKAFYEGLAADLPQDAMLTSKGGIRHPVDGSLTPIQDENERLMGFVLAFRDITPRKQLEESLQSANEMLEQRVQERTERLLETNQALQASESRFRSIAESALDGIIVADEKGHLVYSNRSVQTLFGYSEKELATRRVEELMPERHRDSLRKSIDLLSKGGDKGAAPLTELQGLDKSGREFPVEVSLASWRAGDRRFYAGILRDVTERYRAQASLRFQANVLSQVKDAVIVTNPEGVITYWNGGAEKLFSRKVVDAIGRTPKEVLGQDLVPASETERFLKNMASGGVWQAQTAYRRPNGDEVHADVAIGSLRAEGGDAIGLLAVLWDVTERKKLESLLIQSEKLAAMGQMAAGVAHELKTPMGTILGFADVLQQKLGNDSENMELLETIKRQISRCSNLVDNLLGFARKHGPWTNETASMKEVMTCGIALVTPHATARSVMIRKEIPEEDMIVRGAQDLLEQVLINLSVNAVDAMPRGGTLTLRVRKIQKDAGSVAQMEVTDTGVGIPPEVQKHLFEPFYTTKEAAQGTGLGLWLSREIVHALGGTIECTSAEGRGTMFTVSLPLPKESKEEK